MKKVFCPQCLSFAVMKETLILKRCVCPKCKTRIRPAACAAKQCPECGETYYMPLQMVSQLALPCAAAHMARAKEAAAAALAAREAAEQYEKQLQEQKVGDKIVWPDDVHSFVYVHHLGSSIKPGSVIVVNEGQMGMYLGGGRTMPLVPGTYAIFEDRRSEEEIMRAMYDRSDNTPGIALRLNTNVIFFNTRRFELQADWQLSLRNRTWGVTLPLTMHLQLTEPRKLMDMSLDMKDPALSRKLESKAVDAVLAALYETAAPQAEQAAAECAGGDEMAAAACEVINSNQVMKAANDRLQVYGLRVHNLTVERHRVQSVYKPDSEQVLCPAKDCGSENWIPRKSRADLTCSHCGRRLRWCDHCGRFVTVECKESGNVCDFCQRRLYD